MNNWKKLSVTIAGATLTATAFTCGLVISSAVSANAVILNGSFENGDNGYESIGDFSTETTDFGSGPTEGNNQALITNGDGSISGSPNTSVTAAQVEEFLGLAGGTLQNQGATEGSAFRQTFTANAGDVVTFDWNFLTNEPTPSNNNDFALATLAGSTPNLAKTDSTFIQSFTDFNEETDFQNFDFTIPSTGSYTLGFGVVDVGDENVDSGLLVDNVSLQGSAVPFELSPRLGILALGAWGVTARLKSLVQKRKF